MDETYKLIPEVASRAFAACQKVDFRLKRQIALRYAVAAAGTAAAGSSTPVPAVGVGSFLVINIGMLIGIALTFGLSVDIPTATAIAVSTAGALALRLSVKMALGEVMKLLPGIGSTVGIALESSTAFFTIYGVGHAFTEFLLRFFTENTRMPAAEELKRGFERYWRSVKNETPALPEM